MHNQVHITTTFHLVIRLFVTKSLFIYDLLQAYWPIITHLTGLFNVIRAGTFLLSFCQDHYRQIRLTINLQFGWYGFVLGENFLCILAVYG